MPEDMRRQEARRKAELEAWTRTLINNYWASTIGFLERLGCHPNDSEDLCSITLNAVAGIFQRDPSLFQNDTSESYIKHLIFVITRRKFNDLLRRHYRQKAFREGMEVLKLAETSGDPNRETLYISELLSILPAKTVELILQKKILGKTWDEVREVIDGCENTLRDELTEAMVVLRHYLETRPPHAAAEQGEGEHRE